MNNVTVPQINSLIDTPDNIEIIRDQIAAILSLEIQNQFNMANTREGVNPNDYKIPVYVENGRPYISSSGKPIMRFINVITSKTTSMKENSRLGNQKEQAVFFIDCAACGNDSGDFRDDKSAAFRAWKVMRIVRRIIMSDTYLYLGLRGIVGSRVIASMEAGTPGAIDGDSSLAYVVVRATLNTQFIERSVPGEYETLERIDFEVTPETGEITSITELGGQ